MNLEHPGLNALFPAPPQRHRGARGGVALYAEREVLAIRVVGHTEKETASVIERATRDVVGSNDRFLGFYDSEDLTGYDPEARRIMLDFHRAHVRQIGGMVILLGRAWEVVLAARTVSRAIPGVTMVDERDRLEAALRTALGNTRRRRGDTNR